MLMRTSLVGSRVVVKMVYKNELCGVYSISAGSDCGLYGFPKDVGSEENKIETKLNMVKEGFLCQTYV